jgi:peptidoglycan L-alanyl-D-glutamate endopeptidase CwlK
MKNHGDFINDLQKIAVGPSEVVGLQDILRLSRMGVAPEGMGSISVNAIVDSLYKLNAPPYQPPKPPAEIVPPAPKFHLGGKSQGLLSFVIPELARVVGRAIELTTVDFTVTQTIRSLAEQQDAVKTGHSRTMQSLHLKQPDGYAHAVDLAAWVNGEISWADDLYADIALAMDKASTEQGVAQHIRWGGAWDRRLSDFGGDHAAYLKEIRDYRARHPGSDLIDQPHYEWQA